MSAGALLSKRADLAVCADGCMDGHAGKDAGRLVGAMSSARRVRPKAWGARAMLPTTSNATGATNQRLAKHLAGSPSEGSPSGGQATHWLQTLASSGPRLSWTGPTSVDDKDHVATLLLSELGTAHDEQLAMSAPSAAATRSSLETGISDVKQAGIDPGTETAQNIVIHSPCAVSKPAAALRRSVSGPDTAGAPDERSEHDGHAALQSDTAKSVNGAHHDVANGGVCSTSENTVVRGGLGEHLQKVCGLEHAATQEIQGEERDDEPSVEGDDGDAERRIRNLTSIVRFQEWEAKCMRQDIKVALNTSLWNSITGPCLHAIVEHVRARRNATQESLAWRRRFHSIQCCFATWHDQVRASRLLCRGRAGAERLRARLDRSMQCSVLWDWAALCASSHVPPPSSSRQASVVHAPSPDKSGCFGGLFRCFGGSGRGQKAKGCGKTDVESDGHRQTAAV